MEHLPLTGREGWLLVCRPEGLWGSQEGTPEGGQPRRAWAELLCLWLLGVPSTT